MKLRPLSESVQKNQLVVFPVSGIDSVTVLSFARGRDDEYQNDYAKAEVIEEFLTGNTVRTDSTSFTSSLSGTVGRFGGGCDAKLSQSIYIFGEYDYATGDHIQLPWSVSAGLRWQW